MIKKAIKKLALLALLSASFGSQGEVGIEDKIACAADSIVINSMLEFNELGGLPSRTERMYVWGSAATKKLVELGKTPKEADTILTDAVKESRKKFTIIFQDKSTSIQEKFDTDITPILKRCVNKYFNKSKEKTPK